MEMKCVTGPNEMPQFKAFRNYADLQKVLDEYDLDCFNCTARVRTYTAAFGIECLCQLVAEDSVTAGESDLLRHVSGSEGKPYEPDLGDLARLHWLVLKRKAISILEFGSGFSTVILADALRILSELFAQWANENLRCELPFHVHSVEENPRFIDITAKRLPDHLKSFASLYLSKVELEYVDHRIATFYSKLPNVSPDFIYLDGPSQCATAQNLRGISLASPERMPMSADILPMEFFLQPGTLIVIDGRTANARFLRATLKRSWSYLHDVNGDIHLLELQESPLGPLNRRQLDFCLPDGWQLPATECM
jgi:hypothetical protein